MQKLPEFQRDFFDPNLKFTRIGDGAIGGKAQALVSISGTLKEKYSSGEGFGFEINIPAFTVICTGVFDAFLEQNSLYDLAHSNREDETIAHEFQKADFPVQFLGDIRGLVEKVHVPLAVRSSSLLEDSLQQPFAGIYTTKMIPNNAPSADERFRKFIEAIKLVYASAFFRAAKDYIVAAGVSPADEKMAVLVQEVVGVRHNERFYPEISGVARSYNYYAAGRSKPEQGVVSLALGLGKTIVDGDPCWTYSPAMPKIAPPTASVRELLNQTQSRFWAVHMGKPPAYDPLKETEYMLHCNLSEAESDDTLKLLASTYDPQSDRLTIGIGRQGPRVLNFAGVLHTKNIPLNDLIRELLKLSEEEERVPVEIEFAVTLNPRRFGFLQVRPMMVSAEEVKIAEEDLNRENAFIVSNSVLGNGVYDSIQDIIYLVPEKFDLKFSKQIAQEVAGINRRLLSQNRPYLLMGFGRWGSADPWLGIPVNWGQVSGAKVIVEATLPQVPVDLSQGSHFFHNLISFKVSYFSVRPDQRDRIRWDWLTQQQPEHQTEFIRHIKLQSSLKVLVDGRKGRGVVLS